MRNLVGALSFALLIAASMTIGAAAPALADVSCRPGSWTPGCATQKGAPQNPALAALTCRPGSSLPGCATQTQPEPPTVTALTASFHGLPDAHDGSGLFTFELRFSEEFAGLRLGMLRRTLEVTGGRLVDVKRTVRGKNRSMTVRVRPSSSGDVTVALPEVGWLWSAASATVAGPSAPSALTATFHGLPDAHNGNKLFSFEIRFNEEFDGLSLTALKKALKVTGGRLIDVKRTVRGENRRVTVRVRPASHEPVTVVLGATDDCSAAGAICASDGRKLSGSLSASVTSPAWQTAPVVRALSPERLRSLNLHPPRAKAVESYDPTTSAPSGLPSTTGTVVNINAMEAGTVIGGATRPNIQLRERYIRGGHIAVPFPCKTATDGVGTCVIGSGFVSSTDVETWQTNLATWNAAAPEDRADNPPEDPRTTGGVSVYGRWFSYPHDAGTNDMKVHLKVLRGTHTDGGKPALVHFFDNGHSKDYLYEHLDFFTAEAYLEAPGTAVQPTIAQNSSATWTGKVVALDTAREFDLSGKGNFWRRGDVIGGTATIELVRTTAPNPNANVRLTNLVGANIGTSYPDLHWTLLLVSNGSFSGTNTGGTTNVHAVPGAKISGTFRGSGGTKVGGTFEVPPQHFAHGRYIGMVGGFIADKD